MILRVVWRAGVLAFWTVETLVAPTLLLDLATFTGTGLVILRAVRFFGFFITNFSPGGTGVNGIATIRIGRRRCNLKLTTTSRAGVSQISTFLCLKM